jgi:hypothetical protein
LKARVSNIFNSGFVKIGERDSLPANKATKFFIQIAKMKLHRVDGKTLAGRPRCGSVTA